MDPGLEREARAWLAHDPDEADRADLDRLLAAGDELALADRFSAPLAFGTAGLRGAMRAGPNGMNTAVVRRAAAGLADHLRATSSVERPVVVVGHDRRHRSRAFAEQTAAVLAGAGLTAHLLDAAVPTPLLAFAVRTLPAGAGVMITASHNPASDNGFKVYFGGPAGDAATGAQIDPSTADAIETAITWAAPADLLPTATPTPLPAAGLAEDYLAAVVPAALAPGVPSPRALRLAVTPLHGVGGELLLAALRRAGFPEPAVVDDQFAPDPDFPTVPFPNPEESGALDRLVALVRDTRADLGIAVDPDADRCAALVPDGRGDTDTSTTRTFTGDELGWLLADAVLRRRPGPVATSVVSSTMLAALARRAGVRCAVTLTGFKHLVRADPELAFAYEEALGYAVTPQLVRDKDGIGAAVLLADLADELAREGRTLLDRLDELAAVGLYLTAPVTLRLPVEEIAERLRGLAEHPPHRLGAFDVRSAGPIRADEAELPSGAGLVLRLDGGRVVVRASGTEPKIKAYLEVVDVPPGNEEADVARAREAARDRLDGLRRAVEDWLGAQASN